MLLLTEPAEPAEGECTEPRRSFLLEQPEGRARGLTHGSRHQSVAAVRTVSVVYIILSILYNIIRDPTADKAVEDFPQVKDEVTANNLSTLLLHILVFFPYDWSMVQYKYSM